MARNPRKNKPITLKLSTVVIICSICVIVTTIAVARIILMDQMPTWEEIKGNVTAFVNGERYVVPVSAAEGTLEVHYIDVGQGDSILIKTPEKNMLIDGGENNMGEVVTNYLLSNGVTKIDLMIATHPHSDHIGGLDVVCENIPTLSAMMPELALEHIPITHAYEDFMEVLSDEKIEIIYPEVGKTYDMGGGAMVTILGPDRYYDNINNLSISVRLDFGDASFIFTGDAESDAELAMVGGLLPLQADVMHIGHHGSDSSSSREYLLAVNPKIGVVSCGIDNDYGHPHEEVLTRVSAYAEIFRTDTQGDIFITTDGQEISVQSNEVELYRVAA